MRLHPIAASIAVFLCISACGERSTPRVQETPRPEAVTEAPASPAVLTRTASPDGARAFFITPADGDAVSNPIRIEFGVEGISVVKAGDDQPNSGHHHLLIDTDLPELGTPIPADANHIHFGDGSTSTEITLEPGQHTLRMLLGDHLHIPHDPALISDPITITVE